MHQLISDLINGFAGKWFSNKKINALGYRLAAVGCSIICGNHHQRCLGQYEFDILDEVNTHPIRKVIIEENYFRVMYFQCINCFADRIHIIGLNIFIAKNAT